MIHWKGRCGRLAVLGAILAGMAPGCDGETPDANGHLPTDGVTDDGTRLHSSETNSDAGAETTPDAGGAAPDAGAPTTDDGGTSTAYSGSCHADPDPTPELLQNSELDAAVIARAAAVLSSCSNSDDGVARIATELWSSHLVARKFWYLYVTQARCLSEARCGCEAMDHCLGFRMETGVAPGCQSSCNGEVFRGCGQGADLADGYAIDIDCAKVGQHCHPTAICVEDAQTTCDDSEPAVCRDGARPLFCENGALHEGPDCAGLGLGCADGVCQGTGEACTSQPDFGENEVHLDEGVSCRGGILQACVDGKRASLPCAEQGPGFNCQSVNGVTFCGLASECVPGELGGYTFDPEPTCDGTRMTFCNAGKLETIDCAELGFTGCEVAPELYHHGCVPGLADLIERP